MMSQEYSLEAVASIFRVQRWTVYNWIKQGKLISIRYSERRQFIPHDEVVRFYNNKNCNFDLQHRLMEVVG